MRQFSTSAARASWKGLTFGSTALTALFMVAAAHAADVAPPAAGTLPGLFSSNGGAATTYLKDSPVSGTITTGTGAAVLQWGGTALGTTVPVPAGITTIPGFNIGSGATLTINGVASSVLVSDQTGNPSQIYGTLNAGIAGPLYVANSNGVIVGSSGIINASPGGVGLIGYAVDSSSFADTGRVTVDNATRGVGDVTVMSGATVNGSLLVASNGTVNIGAAAQGGPNYVLAGYTFSTEPGSVTPDGALPSGAPPSAIAATGAVVNFTPAVNNAVMVIDQLNAGGAVNNSAKIDLTGNLAVVGLFTNTGEMPDNGNLDNNQLAGGLNNLGVIRGTAGDLVIRSTKGNIQSTGVLDVPSGGALVLEGANVDLEGTVLVSNQALATDNALAQVILTADPTPISPATTGGVVDLATSLITSGSATISANVIRVLTGGSVTSSPGEGGSSFIDLLPGSNASAVSDPFYSLSSLSYTMSMFPGTKISATGPSGTVNVFGGGSGAIGAATSGLNLDGTLSASTINVEHANNINSATGLNGGFSVPNGGTVNLTFSGNVNNSGGAAASGSTAFQNNYVGVTVGKDGTEAGTATVALGGPSYSSSTAQYVNLLVSGNVQLANNASTLVQPSLPAAVLPSYTNNHLVVTATGNIELSGGTRPSLLIEAADTFYWPGLVYLTSGATATNPAAAPNSTASIALGHTAGVFGPAASVNFSNLIPADLNTAAVNAGTGQGGVFFETNNLIMAPGAATSTVTISNNSWANFLTPTQATSFATTLGSQFFGGIVSGNVVNTSELPASAFH